MNKLIKVLAVLMCFSFGSAKAVEIVSFNAASSEAYVGAFVKGIKATAAQYGYDREGGFEGKSIGIRWE